MSQERIRELWGRFLAGGRLGPAEEDELLDALKADETLRSQLLKDVEIDGLLRAFRWKDRGGESFAQAVSDCLANERDGTRFVRKVRERVGEEQRRMAAKSARGRTAFRRPGALADRPYRAAAWAAAILLAVFALVVALNSRPDPTKKEAGAGPPPMPRKVEEDARRAQERRAQERLREIEEQRKRLAEPPAGPDAKPLSEEEKRERLERLAEERRRIEAEMAEAARKAREAQQSPPPEEPRPSPEAPQEKKPEETVAAVARLEVVEGEAFVVGSTGRAPAQAGQDIRPGEGVETAGRASRAVLSFSDRTNVEVGPDTILRDLKVQGGKRIFVEKGTVSAEVAKQPKDQPMIFSTPHGEAKVLGTTLRILVDPDPKKGTRLEVEEGKVRLKNLAGKTVDVARGQYAVAAVGVELAARPNAKVLFEENFDATPVGGLPRAFEVAGPGLFEGNWAVREFEGNRVLEGQGKSPFVMFGDVGWKDYEVEVRVRLGAETSMVALIVRHDPVSRGNYQLEWRQDGVYLRRSPDRQYPNDIKGAQVKIAPDAWHVLRAACRGTLVEFWIDGHLALRSRETASAQGKCKLYFVGGTVFFDDLVVRETHR